jgi:RHS repeat-associated protein
VTQGFTGQESDSGSGALDYFNARTLSVNGGAFMQADPGNAGADVLSPQSWNGYAYVLGNPLGLVDPTGMFSGSTQPYQPGTYEGGCPILCQDLSYSQLIDWKQSPTTFILYYNGPITGGGSGSGSSGTSTGSISTHSTTFAPPAKTGTCPSIPTGPGKNVLIGNINLAEQAAQIFDAQPNGNQIKIKWYYDNVRTGGPMDYKNQPTLHAHPEYDAFGQFNFGAVGSALSLPEEFIKQAAGLASFASFLRQGKLPPKSFGLPWTGPPYGDQPWAQPQISAGYRFTFAYHAGGC